MQQPPTLPLHLRDALRVTWHISNWCNYGCEYCTVQVFPKRSTNGERQPHAFDYADVDGWLNAFARLPHKQTHLKITGGEPFLDRANFRAVLQGLMRLEHYSFRVDTNGTWDPNYFSGIDKSRLLLNISYHPGEIAFDAFLRRVSAIRSAGFPVTNIQYVASPENIEATGEVVSRLGHEGFFVSVQPMMHTGVYYLRLLRNRRELDVLSRYNLPIDVYFRTQNPVTKGRLCLHPALSYFLNYDGSISVYCTNETTNLLTGDPPPLPETAIPCPERHCQNCVEMYRSLVDEPMVDRPMSVYPLDEYIEEVRQYRAGRPIPQDSASGVRLIKPETKRASLRRANRWLNRFSRQAKKWLSGPPEQKQSDFVPIETIGTVRPGTSGPKIDGKQ